MPIQADIAAEGTDPTIGNKARKGGEWSAPLSGSFAPGEDSELITLLGGWVSEPVLKGRKISPPPEFDRRTVQAVACRYTDYAILTARSILTCQKLMCK
jgi:hypothetical protein